MKEEHFIIGNIHYSRFTDGFGRLSGAQIGIEIDGYIDYDLTHEQRSAAIKEVLNYKNGYPSNAIPV